MNCMRVISSGMASAHCCRIFIPSGLTRNTSCLIFNYKFTISRPALFTFTSISKFSLHRILSSGWKALLSTSRLQSEVDYSTNLMSSLHFAALACTWPSSQPLSYNSSKAFPWFTVCSIPSHRCKATANTSNAVREPCPGDGHSLVWSVICNHLAPLRTFRSAPTNWSLKGVYSSTRRPFLSFARDCKPRKHGTVLKYQGSRASSDCSRDYEVRTGNRKGARLRTI